MLTNWLYRSTLECPTHILVHSGGSQSSKTYSILQALFTVASTQKKKVITVVGQDLPNLKKGAIRDAAKIAESEPFFRQQITSYNKADYTYTFRTGSILEFTSYDDEQDAKSGKRDYTFINEANGVAYGIFEQLRIRSNELIVIDFNPSAEFWAHTELLGRSDVTWINSTFRDNEFIHPTTRDAILSYEPTPENIARGTANEYRWKVYGMGEVGRLEGLVFPDYNITPTWPESYKWRSFGMDFGFTNDPTTLIEVVYAHGDLYLRQHLWATGLTNPDIAKELERIGHDRLEPIYADAAEPKSIEELRRARFNIRAAVKGADSVSAGIDNIKRYKVHIHHASKELIEEFGSYTWAKDRDGKPTNKPIDKYNHGIDAIRYALTSRRAPVKVYTRT
jgi:phage terminase large subunit